MKALFILLFIPFIGFAQDGVPATATYMAIDDEEWQEVTLPVLFRKSSVKIDTSTFYYDHDLKQVNDESPIPKGFDRQQILACSAHTWDGRQLDVVLRIVTRNSDELSFVQLYLYYNIKTVVYTIKLENP